MGILSNNVQKGVLRMEGNKNPKNGEDKVYHKFFLEADDNLHFVYGMPKAGWYMFTDTEIDRDMLMPANVTSCPGIELGVMYLFMLGKPCVITKVKLGDAVKTVRLPISLVRRSLERSSKNAEDKTKPGILDALKMF